MARRFATVAAIALFALACVVVGQSTCNTNSGSFQWSTVTLAIQQEVPSQPGLNGMHNWQLALCSPQTATACPNTVASYITEINGNSDGCDVGFNSPGVLGWNPNYGGLTATFYGSTSASSQDDRIANITLICDPMAFQPTNQGNVLASPVSGSSAWLFNIRITTSAVCGLAPPGPNPPGPIPPGPNPPGPSPPAPTATPVPPPTPPPLPTCFNNGARFDIPVTALTIKQVVPSDPSRNADRLWQFALCQPSMFNFCSNIPPSYVIDVDMNSATCISGLAQSSLFGWRDLGYGGISTAFYGRQSADGAITGANVTLICDTAASSPLEAEGPVVVHPDAAGNGWVYDVRLRTNATCGDTN